MKTKLTLTSRFYGLSINILMDADKAEKLMTKEEPIEEINEDIDRFTTGFKTIYLTESQAKKIKNYFNDCNSWNKIEKA